MMNPRTRSTPRRGIGIIEALVSLLVLALGMVSIAALQARLRLNSDVAKQRTEAVRIAQEDIENFRSFGTLSADGSVANNLAYNSVSSASATKTVLAAGVNTKTNTTFTLTRSVVDAPRVAGITDAAVKNLQVTVSWNDRNGSDQSVTLRSVIAQSDPAVAASLALAPNGSPVRDLLGRDIQVPIPSKNLGDGTSAIKPITTGTVAYVFNNDTGVVTKRCSGIASNTVTNSLTLASLAAVGVNCANVNAYLISGFIRSSLGNSASASNPNDVAPGALAMRVDFDSTPPPTGFAGFFTQLTAAYWPAITSAAGTTIGSGGVYSPAECNAEALQTVRYTTPVSFSQVNNGVTTSVSSTTVISIIPQSVTSITAANIAQWVGIAAGDASAKIISPQPTGEKFVGYACLIYPIDLDLNASTAPAYTARLAIWPTAWTLGNTGSDFKICRYSADYNLNGGVRVRANSDGVVNEASGTHIKTIDNQEHTYAYLNAQRSLSNQNYLIIKGNNACPTDGAVEIDGQGGENYTDETTVTHQP